MLTKERIEEIRVAVGDASADPMAPAELAELLAARDVAEAAERVERERRDKRIVHVPELSEGGRPTGILFRNEAGIPEETAAWDFGKALRRYEQAKRGTATAILIHTINRESEASA